MECLCVCESGLHDYHCVRVVLQLVRWHVLVMLLEQVFQESLRDKDSSHNQTTNSQIQRMIHNYYLANSMKNKLHAKCMLCDVVRKSWFQKKRMWQQDSNGSSHWFVFVIQTSSQENCVVRSWKWTNSQQQITALCQCHHWRLLLEQTGDVHSALLCEGTHILFVMATSPWAPELICGRCSRHRTSSISTVGRREQMGQCSHAVYSSYWWVWISSSWLNMP